MRTQRQANIARAASEFQQGLVGRRLFLQNLHNFLVKVPNARSLFIVLVGHMIKVSMMCWFGHDDRFLVVWTVTCRGVKLVG